MSKIKVFKTQLEDYNGPCVVHRVESVLDELKQTLPEMAIGDSFIITVGEMDRMEYKKLPEFLGYLWLLQRVTTAIPLPTQTTL